MSSTSSRGVARPPRRQLSGDDWMNGESAGVMRPSSTCRGSGVGRGRGGMSSTTVESSLAPVSLPMTTATLSALPSSPPVSSLSPFSSYSWTSLVGSALCGLAFTRTLHLSPTPRSMHAVHGGGPEHLIRRTRQASHALLVRRRGSSGCRRRRLRTMVDEPPSADAGMPDVGVGGVPWVSPGAAGTTRSMASTVGGVCDARWDGSWTMGSRWMSAGWSGRCRALPGVSVVHPGTAAGPIHLDVRLASVP